MVSPTKVIPLWKEALENPITIDNEEVKISVSKSQNRLEASTSLVDLLTQLDEEWEKNPKYPIVKQPRHNSPQKILVTML